MKEGLVQVYTGDGKGKTTASLGLALRAIGHNYSVYIIQFLKGGDTGEMFSIQKYLPNMTLVQFGKDALREKQMKIVSFKDKEKIENDLTENHFYKFLPDSEETEPSRLGLEHAKKIISSGRYNVVILDEINCALAKGMIPTKEVIELIKNKPKHVEIVLTGRDAPEDLKSAADLVSNIKRVKHPFDKGVLARKGIEY
jgi:cob(I)alamin adenosyltransferase